MILAEDTVPQQFSVDILTLQYSESFCFNLSHISALFDVCSPALFFSSLSVEICTKSGHKNQNRKGKLLSRLTPSHIAVVREGLQRYREPFSRNELSHFSHFNISFYYRPQKIRHKMCVQLLDVCTHYLLFLQC